jgi:hypothetical protein
MVEACPVDGLSSDFTVADESRVYKADRESVGTGRIRIICTYLIDIGAMNPALRAGSRFVRLAHGLRFMNE